MSTTERKYPAPMVNPEIKPFFDAAAQGTLMLKKCGACGQTHHYPRAICPFCASERTEWITASGRGTIYSYSIMRRGAGSHADCYVEPGGRGGKMDNHVHCGPGAHPVRQALQG